MSDKSGTSEQIISLPKDGAALRAIGETFSPNLHTGTGDSIVLIALPLGRSLAARAPLRYGHYPNAKHHVNRDPNTGGFTERATHLYALPIQLRQTPF